MFVEIVLGRRITIRLEAVAFLAGSGGAGMFLPTPSLWPQLRKNSQLLRNHSFASPDTALLLLYLSLVVNCPIECGRALMMLTKSYTLAGFTLGSLGTSCALCRHQKDHSVLPCLVGWLFGRTPNPFLACLCLSGEG